MNYDKDKFIEEIRQHEGYRDKPYFDSLGILTIGIGHAMGHNSPGPMTEVAMGVGGVMDKAWPEDVLLLLFHHDLTEHERELENLAAEKNVDLNTLQDVQIRGLLNMTFNMGRGRLSKFKKMWEALRDGDWVGAEREALDSRWARQVGRRSGEVANMLLGKN